MLTLVQMCIPLFLKTVDMYSIVHPIQESNPLKVVAKIVQDTMLVRLC